jgi:hypothetical protein
MRCSSRDCSDLHVGPNGAHQQRARLRPTADKANRFWLRFSPADAINTGSADEISYPFSSSSNSFL